MAILNGPYASKMRGKVGEVVAAKTIGNRTAIRSYQPNVKNPNTARQKLARHILAQLSGNVAALASVLNIGFAKACSGLAMYPRNLAMRTFRKGGAGFTFGTQGIVEVDPAELKLSMPMGMPEEPVLNLVAPTDQAAGRVTFTNYDSIKANFPNSELGIVLAFVMNNSETEIKLMGTKMVKAAASVVITYEEVVPYLGSTVLAFVKEVPVSGTPIPTDQWPWKYPAATSATSVIGSLQ